jgi:hypothetical protein
VFDRILGRYPKKQLFRAVFWPHTSPEAESLLPDQRNIVKRGIRQNLSANVTFCLGELTFGCDVHAAEVGHLIG